MTFDPSKPFEKVEEAPKSEGFDPNQPFDVVEEKSVGQRNLEKFGPADVSPSMLERALDVAVPASAGASQGLTAGWADEIGGALTAMGKDIGSVLGLTEEGDYEAERDALRESTQLAAEENPAAYLAGEAGSGIATGLVAPGATLAKMAGQGALYGAGAAEEVEDVPQGAAMGAALAGVGGKVVPAVAGAGSKALKSALDMPAKRMARKVAEAETKAATAATEVRDNYMARMAKKAAQQEELEASLIARQGQKTYKQTYDKLTKNGNYSVKEAKIKANAAAKKKVEQLTDRQELKTFKDSKKAEIKAEEVYDKAYDKALKQNNPAKESQESDLGVLAKTALGKRDVDGRTLAAAARTASGINTAKLAATIGLKTGKGLANVSEKSLRALEAAAKRGGAKSALATHNTLLQTDEAYRKAVTKNQESE